jgi:signal transduction histidine kinase
MEASVICREESYRTCTFDVDVSGMEDWKILLVDDDKVLLDTMGRMMAAAGYTTFTVSTGDSALEALFRDDFDLVITDLNLRDASGLTVLEKAKADNPTTVVFIFTASRDIESSIKALRLGADDYLLKPDHVEELLPRATKALVEVKKKQDPPETRLTPEHEAMLHMVMSVSHDIRSPLVSFGATIKLLARGVYGKIDESVGNTLQELYDRVVRLQRTAEDCLAKAAACNGSVQIAPKVLDVREDIIDPVLAELQPEIEQKGIRIDNRLGAIPARRICIDADEAWLKMVFRNLFSNAIKYGGDGCSIAFGFKDKRTHYEFNVFNTGSVIPEEQRGKLFTRFCTLGGNGNGNGNGTHNGLGLGLYLVKEIVTQHGGDIWYEATGDGSNFVFTLP